ncbi:MAG TPA: CHAT domain-containing protein [Bryobacteraceae bacterium]|nr:CHAT domain-containing protein [Bryobacteraceae bacterium]
MRLRIIIRTALWFIAPVFACVLAAQDDIQSLEQRAQAAFSRRDCAAAEKTFGEALKAAQAAGEIHRTGIYYIRIANCRTRVGDFAAALDNYHQTMAVAEASRDDQLMELGVHGAALQLQKLGRIEEALPLAQREYELAQKDGNADHLARALWLLAEQDEAIGKVRDGLKLMNRALAISRTTTDRAMTGVLLDNLSIIYLALGDPETAAHIEQEILAMPRGELDSMATTYSAANTFNNLGEIQVKAGHPAEARRSFEKAVESSMAADEWRVHSDALLNLARMQSDAGQFGAADAGFRQALEISSNRKFPDGQSAGRQIQSDALLVRGDLKGAADAGAESLRIARQLNSPDRTYKALLSLGAAKAASGEQGAARALFDEALGIAETLRAQSPGEVSDLGRTFANFIPLYQASVKNLIDLHLPAEALQRAEQAKARVLMDILLRGGVDERSVITAAEAAEQDKLRKRLANANGTVDYRQFRRALYDNHPELAVQSGDFEPAGLDRLSALLPDAKTALLDYFFVPSGVALFVVKQSGVSTYFLPDPKHTLAAEARRFREQLADRDLDYRKMAAQLFNRVLAPAMASLNGATEWIVSPDGALWDIPFEALIDPAGRHLIETRAISLTPSLTAAVEIQSRNRHPGSAGLRLLALGNPLPSPAPLPDAAQEVEQIGANFPRGSALVLTGAAATAGDFRDKAASARIIHLAAHAGLNDIDPLSSFVSLGSGGKSSGGDGMVTALDIMSLHLRADMVVLSACETALGSSGPGEGMIGMGWALSAAGASSSVLGMWKVDSAASREFMTSFYKNLSLGDDSVSRSAALRQTGLQMLQSTTYKHPFYWAAFTLWGNGRSR